MDVMILATELNWLGKLVYKLYEWVAGWGNAYEMVGAFGISVILFTIFLKLIVSPLDVWQKLLSRKSARKMEIMKPELDKVTKQCGDNKELLYQKQREVYKKYKYSMFSACLPTIVTMVVFIVVFGGFNSAVRYYNSKSVDDLTATYETTYSQTYQAQIEEGKSGEEAMAASKTAAENAVVEAYKPEKFFLTTNIFMPDTWKNPIPDISVYTGTGIGKLGIADADTTIYNKVMSPLIKKYNVNEKGKSKWNGYLILPILTIALSIISSKLIKQPEQPQVAGQTEEQQRQQKNTAKTMQYVMPAMMGVFSLFYSAAFTIYMLISSLFTLIFNIVFNLITTRIDKKNKDRLMSITVKK